MTGPCAARAAATARSSSCVRTPCALASLGCLTALCAASAATRRCTAGLSVEAGAGTAAAGAGTAAAGVASGTILNFLIFLPSAPEASTAAIACALVASTGNFTGLSVSKSLTS